MNAESAIETTDQPLLGELVCREEVRPGLTMIKRKLLKEDGRYLLHYGFERAEDSQGTVKASEVNG